MTEETFFKISYFVLIMIASVVRKVYTAKSRKTKTKDDYRTTTDKILVSLPAIGMLIMPIIYVSSSWLDFADYQLPVWAGILGIVVFFLCIWSLWRSHVDLGLNWSEGLEIREEQTLITQGIYKYIRHPMYASHWIWGIAQVLLLQNWIAGFSMLISMAPLYFYRVPKEEKMMIDQFGDQYRVYLKRTGRIIPRFW